jgi:hypothetical protein
MLADDVQPGSRQEMMDIGHAPGNGVLDRIMARPAGPSSTAAKASSKVGQGRASQSGRASEQAVWELAPSSPWKEMSLFMMSSETQ